MSKMSLRTTQKKQKIKKPSIHHKKVFDEDYFTDYYHAMTGDFAHKDLIRNRNWFYGWFDALKPLYDFSKGKGRKAMEIGCAIGAAASILHDRGFDVIATDISPYAVKKAKKLLPHISFDIVDAEKPPKKYANSQDVIFAFEVIEHLPNPELAIENFRAMLKKGGSLICSTPYPYKYVFVDETHINVRYPEEWVKAFRKAGFKKIEYKHIGFIPFFYRFSPRLHVKLPFGLPIRYFNSTIFIHATK